jgi:hypothetical protein
MNKIIFIDTNRKLRAKSTPRGRLRVFHHAPGTFRPAHSALTCIWRIDPRTGRLAASWSFEAVDDLTHCTHKSHFTSCAAGIAPAARAA